MTLRPTLEVTTVETPGTLCVGRSGRSSACNLSRRFGDVATFALVAVRPDREYANDADPISRRLRDERSATG
jgi:hypothetical protein